MEHIEVVLTSDSAGQLWNSAAWEPQSGTTLTSYRGGGVAAPRTLALLGQDYIASAERTKPILHIWPLNSQEQVQGLRLVLPGRATALCFSPNGSYCVAGIEEKIYIWQISSGSLLAVASRHYQQITSIKFCDDGSHFVSAGDDGLVLVWSLLNLISNPAVDVTSQSNSDPLYIFSDHSLPVNDIFVGKGGIRSRLVTVSTDRTCKIYNLASGELLLNVVFEKSLTAVTMDMIEMNVFVGTSEGEIYQFSITNPPRAREYYINEKDSSIKFSGHTKSITTLSTSVDGETLVSGSTDEHLLVWHIPSRQKIHDIPHKGAILNAFFTIVPKNMFTSTFNPSIILHSFQRVINTESSIEILTKEDNDFWEFDGKSRTDSISFSSLLNTESTANDLEKANDQVDDLKRINSNLYLFAVGNILKDLQNKPI